MLRLPRQEALVARIEHVTIIPEVLQTLRHSSHDHVLRIEPKTGIYCEKGWMGASRILHLGN